MKKLITGVLLVALSFAPSIALAGIPGEPSAAVTETPGVQLAESALVDNSLTGAPNYAAREAATPQLAQFEGGSGGIWIGTGVLVVAVVVLLILLVR
ncbi:MAG: hypothetical protein ABSF35_20460 [Polyangia bacterium]|jgi:hypothetical protein